MILVTGNKNKIEEFEFILGFKIENIDLELEEIQSIDVGEVARHKARNAYNILKKPVITEDTGLYFEELNGLPGALVKFFVKSISLDKMCSLVGENRKARATTCIVFFDGEKETIIKGETRGEIAINPRGNNGFGWDPIFIPEGYDKTFAELTSEEKQSKFMRQEAIAQFKEKLTI
ncbi:MAG: RdgB/HAM1 family non-canonical purine NTP pyrophosphatase [Candidatus Pacebacteria bacterium]|nr:RdgB/HAM1 family non-canonical purine NTP pyrophosphatase [Candidatus Paceibacterota bacterium]MDD2757471.1 RdgB/HAM1 family non-canonical purine NTP pyrophosphatase [Candidatus Paceibacterota bacterium]MDD3970079.1 RdgB/HAM1 family non-canonical purine NTP pyrophosphatase [Candidatus Paceibacterota bacterium]